MSNDAATWQVLLAAGAVLVTVATYVGNRLRDQKTRTAELVRTYTRDLYSSPSVLELFQEIDHEEFRYSSSLIGTEVETTLIELLDHLNSVGHNVGTRVLSLADIMPTTIAYAVVRTYSDAGVQQYLRQIRCWDEARLVPGYGFRYFEELAIRILTIRSVHTGTPAPELVVHSAPLRPTWKVRSAVRFPSMTGLLLAISTRSSRKAGA